MSPPRIEKRDAPPGCSSESTKGVEADRILSINQCALYQPQPQDTNADTAF
ncbi:MAG: hypothetical protein AB7V26_02325 [Lysobacterales bacterium]